jgi:hypothetical protein
MKKKKSKIALDFTIDKFVPTKHEHDFEIDKLTNSIENSLTGEIFHTQITPLTAGDIKSLKKGKWRFDWNSELKVKSRKVFKLETIENPGIIHGLISIEKRDLHIFMHLLENASFNIGKNKAYKGVAGNLVAFACKTSFEYGFEGCIAFIAKTTLIDHYKSTLKADQISGQRMFIDTKNSLSLVKQYFKDFEL